MQGELPKRVGPSGSKFFAAASVAVVIATAALLAWNSSDGLRGRDRPLVVYCAAGVRPAVEPLLDQYRSEYRVDTVLHVGPSGAIESQALLSGRGDLIIPAATQPFLERLQRRGAVREVIPVATLRLVVGHAPGFHCPESIDELFDGTARVGLCNTEAAAGQRTRLVLEQAGTWDKACRAAAVSLPTVTELADALRTGGRLDAAFVWSTTAEQFGLDYREFADLSASPGTVAVGVLDSSSKPTAALRLARYLTSIDRGQPSFELAHYTCLPGDRWAETPQLEVVLGAAEHDLVADSIAEFNRREGCKVTVVDWTARLADEGDCRVLIGDSSEGETCVATIHHAGAYPQLAQRLGDYLTKRASRQSRLNPLPTATE